MYLPLIAIILYVLVFLSAVKNRFRMPHKNLPFIIVVFLPIIGPIIYFYLMYKEGNQKRKFFDGKRRFSK